MVPKIPKLPPASMAHTPTHPHSFQNNITLLWIKCDLLEQVPHHTHILLSSGWTSDKTEAENTLTKI